MTDMTNSELRQELLRIADWCAVREINALSRAATLRLAAERIPEDGLIQMRPFQFETTMWRMFNFGKDNNTVSAQCEIQAANIAARPEDE